MLFKHINIFLFQVDHTTNANNKSLTEIKHFLFELNKNKMFILNINVNNTVCYSSFY